MWMKIMRKMVNKRIILLCIMVTLNATHAFADTDGTELQILQPETLDVQLGEEWAGMQFQLMTDAGIYPEKITVDDDGILRLELGGSSKYTLSCLNSSVKVLKQNEKDALKQDKKNNNSLKKMKNETVKPDGKTVAGIPVIHIFLFTGGMLIAITVLLIMKFISRSKAKDRDEYDEDYSPD